MINQDMDLEPFPIIRKPPVCGIASITVPFVACGIAVVLFVTRSDDAGGLGMDGNSILAVLSIIFGLIAGTFLGGVGVYREERFDELARFGLALNALPLIALLICSC